MSFIYSVKYINFLLLQGIVRRMSAKLHRIISRRMVPRDTDAHRLIEEALDLGRGVTEERNMFVRRIRRGVQRGQGSGTR